jgi:hypothetical protein
VTRNSAPALGEDAARIATTTRDRLEGSTHHWRWTDGVAINEACVRVDALARLVDQRRRGDITADTFLDAVEAHVSVTGAWLRAAS